jgi:hypothetical protein
MVEAKVGGELGSFGGQVVGPRGVRGAAPSWAVYYTPNPDKPRPGGPEWVLFYVNEPLGRECVGVDFRSLDREAEVEAFRRAYSRELAELAELAGREPILGWGVIYSYR